MIRLRAAARAALMLLGAAIALFALLLLYLWLSGRVWYPRQRSRVAQLETGSVRPANEDAISVTPLDDALPLSSLRMIASHNSYHLEPDPVRMLLIDLVEPGESATLRYSHQPLWDQLENGIRSFELDIRARRDRFTITHVPLVDNRGPHPDFELALREIVLWSERRPGHVPVIVVLELKSDYMFLDPGLVEWDADALERLDALVRKTVPAKRLLTRAMVRREADSLLASVSTHGWPALSDVRDRIMFVVHTNTDIDPLYVAGDPGLADRPMFTSRPGSVEATSDGAPTRPDAVIAIHNDPDPASIAGLIVAGMLVRTRADADAAAPPEQRTAALASGAQIVSTDLPPGHPNDPDLGVVEFAAGKTLVQR